MPLGGRFDWARRWTGVLQRELKDFARIIEEGLDGRTTVYENPLREGRNGLSALPCIIQTHAPVDLIVIMLGTNDMKSRLNQTPFSIAQGASRLIEVCKEYKSDVQNVLLISPALIVNTEDFETQMQMEGGLEKSKELASHYKYFAHKHGIHFFDAASVVNSSVRDGIHWEEAEHLNFGREIAKLAKEILK